MRRFTRMRPLLDLEEFKRLLRQDPDFYLAEERGTKDIMQARRCSASEAREFARDAALSLEPADYSGESFEYDEECTADAYCKMIEDEGWYIKILLRNEAPGIGSCHLTLERAETVGGRIVPRSHRT